MPQLVIQHYRCESIHNGVFFLFIIVQFFLFSNPCLAVFVEWFSEHSVTQSRQSNTVCWDCEKFLVQTVGTVEIDLPEECLFEDTCVTAQVQSNLQDLLVLKQLLDGVFELLLISKAVVSYVQDESFLRSG